MRLRPFIVPAAMLTVTGGLLSWLLLAEPPAPPDTAKSTQSTPENTGPAAGKTGLATQETPQKSADRIAAAAPLPDQIRNVSPDGVTSPRVSGALKRIEPSKRYLELKNPPAEPIPDGPLEFTRVQVLDSGHLRSGKLKITLAHMKGLAPDETCASDSGTPWPCGARATTFLRGLVRQLKIECSKIAETGPQEILATCKRGTIDLSARLIRYGWGDAAPGAPDHYADLALKAREHQLGKWQTDWVAKLPSELSATTETTLPGLEDLNNLDALTQQVVEWSLKVEPEAPGQDLPVEEGTLPGLPPAQ